MSFIIAHWSTLLLAALMLIGLCFYAATAGIES